MSCRCVGRISSDHAHQWLPEHEGENKTQRWMLNQNTPSTQPAQQKGAKERKNYVHTHTVEARVTAGQILCTCIMD